MTNVDKSRYKVAEWIFSCQNRFKRMYDAGIDKNGYPAIQKAIKHFDEHGFFTVGQVQYWFHRSHRYGAYSDYNTHKNYNKRYGEILPCPIKDLVNSGVVRWRTGQNGVIHGPFCRAIKEETLFEWRQGDLRPQHHTTFSDLFERN